MDINYNKWMQICNYRRHFSLVIDIFNEFAISLFLDFLSYLTRTGEPCVFFYQQESIKLKWSLKG